MLGLAMLVFLISLAYETVATRELYAIEAKNPDLAGLLSAILEGFSWLFVIVFSSNRWLAIPAVLGAYLGTRLVVAHERRKDAAQSTLERARGVV